MLTRSRPARVAVSSAAIAFAVAASLATGQTFTAVERDDLAYGLNRNAAAETTHLVRGYPVGARATNEWGVNFVQSVQFDNVDGFRGNPNGNLLGVNFGTTTAGGSIFSMQTKAGSGANPGNSTLIFDFATYNAANPSNPLTISRLGGLSVSPNNTRVALAGNDGGNVYVFDYAPGDGTGTGNLLTNGQQFSGVVASGSTQGTAWLDNNTLLLTDNTGALKRLDVSTGSVSTIATLPTTVTTSFFSSVVYDPTISPNAYVSLAGLNAGVTVNQMYVVNPASGAIVRSLDYSTSMNTARELAFNSRGDLLVGVFGNTSSVPLGGSVEIITNAADAAGMTDNVSTEYYIQATGLSAQFSGLDVAADQLDYVTPGVTVDVRKRTHLQRYFTPTAPLDDLRQRIRTGFNNGAWNGAGGILSTDAAANAGHGLGYADAATLLPPVVTTGPSFVVRYTLLGDANLNGTVNIGDFSVLASNFNQPGLWTAGDFNYDGQVNIGDFSLLASNFNRSVSPATGARGAAVPEPTAAAGALIAIAALAARRGKR